jgi:regulator of sirC expression with transglutaminase-like and TPR domain
MMHEAWARALVDRADDTDPDALVRGALDIARIEHHALDPEPTLAQLAELGRGAARRLAGLAAPTPDTRIAALSGYLFDEMGFAGNELRFEDPRNSCLNDVLERRTGIPISLAVVYIDVARRAGVALEGVNFPGHFLVRYPARSDDLGHRHDLLIDPFHGGALVSEADCRRLVERYVGSDASFSADMLATADRRQIFVRMLMNLKRLYVRGRSFPQAHAVSHLLLALEPSSLAELRDRGLLAHQLRDYAGALRDLEAYLNGLSPAPQQVDEETRSEYEQIWEHVKGLRKRLASFN